MYRLIQMAISFTAAGWCLGLALFAVAADVPYWVAGLAGSLAGFNAALGLYQCAMLVADHIEDALRRLTTLGGASGQG